jgi:rhamnose transport system permease protein
MSTTLDQPKTTPTRPALAHRLRRIFLGRDVAIIVLLIVVYLFGYSEVPYFAGNLTINLLLQDVFPILLIALPMTLVIITGEIDLSVASTLGLSSVTVGVLYQAHWSIPAAAVVAMLVGLACGALNGFLITIVGLPSLAVTVGTLALYRGLAVGLLGTTAVTGFPATWTNLVASNIGGLTSPIPLIMVVFVVLAIVFIVLLHFTPVGRAIYAIGLNDEAAIFSGVNATTVKFWLYIGTGVISAFAGIVWTLHFNSARGDNALGYELSIIAAVLVGGVSSFGGRGALPGVIAAVLVIGTLRALLRLANVTDDVINVATGALLIIAVIVPRVFIGIRALRARSAVRKRRENLPAA